MDIIAKDRAVLLFLNNLGNHYFDPFWMLMSEKWIWVPLYLIFFYLLYKKFLLKNLIYILIFVAIGIAVSDQLAGVFKNGFLRLRPCHDPLLISKIRLVTCGGPFGFYSSHASNSFFIATFLTILLRKKYIWLPFLLFFWASLVSYSRIYLGVHFPLDVAFGAVIGFLLGGFFATLCKNTIYKKTQLR